MIDPIILKQKVNKWHESLKYLKEHQSDLTNEEWTAIEDLQDKWRGGNFNDDMVEEATDMVQTLIDGQKFHGNNRDIIRHSKEFSGIARDIYTRDAETFGQFFEALGGARKRAAASGAMKPRSSASGQIAMKQDARKWRDAVVNLIASWDKLSDAQQRAIRLTRCMWDLTWEQNTATAMFANELKNMESVAVTDADVSVWVTNYCSVIRKYALENEELYNRFEPIISDILSVSPLPEPVQSRPTPTVGQGRTSTPPPPPRSSGSVPPPPPAGAAIRVTEVTFRNTDYDGNTLSTGSPLPSNSQYVKPVIKYVSESRRKCRISYRVYNSRNEFLGNKETGVTGANDLDASSGAGTLVLIGWGNRNGTFWIPGKYRVEILCDNVPVKTAEFEIQSRPVPVPGVGHFTITGVKFQNVRQDGSVISNDLPHNTCYVAPTITFESPGLEPRVDVDYTIYGPDGARISQGVTGHASINIGNKTSGAVGLPSYGNDNGRYWKPGATYRIVFKYLRQYEYSSTFTIAPVPRSVSSSQSSGSLTGGSGEKKRGYSWFWWVLIGIGVLWIMPKGCMSCSSDDDYYEDTCDTVCEVVEDVVEETPVSRPARSAKPVEKPVVEAEKPVDDFEQTVNSDDYLNDFVKEETPAIDYNKQAEEPDYNKPAEEPEYTKPVEDNTVYDRADQQPQFPGGDAALMKWIAGHINYPASAVENGIQGAVVVQFVVMKDGTIGEVRIRRGRDADLDREAMRVVRTLPQFTPGKKNGVPVNVWYTLPITFRLN